MISLRKFFRDVHLNRVIKILTLSDLLIWSGFGLMNPIFAVFATEQIIDGNLEVAGFAASIYLAIKSILQIPVARYIDLKKGERDDFMFLLLGSILMAVTPFLYIFASYAVHIYIIQAIFGVGSAFAFAAWDAIFTRHLDKNEVAFEWSVYYTVIDVGGAITAGAGGIMATHLGFQPLFLTVGIITTIGALLLVGAARQIGS